MSAEVVTVGWIPTADTFGARLALIRQRMGWNAKEAATECGIPPQSWREWENGRSPRDQEKYARLIAQRTGADYLWLFTGVPGGPSRGPITQARTHEYTPASTHPHRPSCLVKPLRTAYPAVTSPQPVGRTAPIAASARLLRKGDRADAA